ncbi:helix-turn-helix domain-containing protein [Nocardioides sp. GY 10127]|uniref:helix-turn-helix domain-containing protein n=1 Tax=Nocardioides sp. GY 10127 TaxID=2569762 RepID=UPI0010A90F5C|nr:helix-turn-helix domain-containing protein [Nocardioides sp. GY 10127]TIC78814.1 helix-turn-helix domain-containing protein [Nocardioides sp. GY 10127]
MSYSLAEAAEATGMSVSFLRGEISNGRLAAKRLGSTADGEPAGKYLIKAESLAAYIRDLLDA